MNFKTKPLDIDLRKRDSYRNITTTKCVFFHFSCIYKTFLTRFKSL